MDFYKYLQHEKMNIYVIDKREKITFEKNIFLLNQPFI